MTAKPIDVVILTEDRYLHPVLGDWYQAQIAHEEALVGEFGSGGGQRDGHFGTRNNAK